VWQAPGLSTKRPGQTHVWTSTADRQFFATALNCSGVPIGEDPPASGESWCVHNDTLLIRRSKGGPFGLKNLLPWVHVDLNWHIDSLSDVTLIVDGGPGSKQLRFEAVVEGVREFD
jgi:hypothetical protein